MAILPSEIAFGKVVGRFILAVADGLDSDSLPDAVAATGTVRLTPKNANLKTLSPAPATVVAQPVDCGISSDGYILGPNGAVGVWLVVGIYTVTYSLDKASIKTHDIEVLATHTDSTPLDLTSAIPPGGALLSATEYATLSARIDGIGASGGGGGTGGAVASVAGKTGAVTLVTADVGGLSTSLGLKADKSNPTFTGTVTGVTKAHVGLGNVDNTSDAAKPISTLTAAALAGKAATSHTHATADVAGLDTALAGKASTTHTHGPSGLTGTGTKDATTFYRGDGVWAVPTGTGSGTADPAPAYLSGGGYYLDSYAGTDDQRLTAAIADQRASAGVTNYAPIILPSRPLSFTTSRQLYTGLRIIGAHRYGQKNPDISSGNYSGPEITLSGAISSGAASWWTDPGGNCYDVYMADFSVQGSQGASVHQFIDNPSNTLYACEFHALSFNFMRGVFGRNDRKSLLTQVNLSGMWTINNAWDCQLYVGGSDCTFWMDSIANIGIASSSLQAGGLSTYFIKLESIEVNLGKVYCSTMNGWRGILVNGSGSIVNFFDGVLEGYKPTRINGLIEGPGPGSQLKIDAGVVSLYGTKIGQGMDNPDASEDGLVQVNGGEVNMFGVNFYGRNMGTVNAVDHNGGRLMMTGTTKRQNEGAYWTGRPRVSTTATAGSGTTSFYCPDQSVTVV